MYRLNILIEFRTEFSTWQVTISGDTLIVVFFSEINTKSRFKHGAEKNWNA